MAFDVNNPYFRTKVLTASPEQLRLLLIDGCLRFLADGRDGLAARDFMKSHENFTGARNIIMELINTLRHEIAPELCAKMESLYLYIFGRVVEGSFEKDTAKIDEAISLMEYERETWVLLMQKLAEERGEIAPAAAPPHAGAGAESPRAAFSVSG